MMLAPYKEPLTGVTYYPHYWSTYCQHNHHGDCRLTCKTCDEPCRCSCHHDAQPSGVGDDGDLECQICGAEFTLNGPAHACTS